MIRRRRVSVRLPIGITRSVEEARRVLLDTVAGIGTSHLEDASVLVDDLRPAGDVARCHGLLATGRRGRARRRRAARARARRARTRGPAARIDTGAMTRVRFAPSPNRLPPRGNALTAVANRAFGDWLLLRIDDTDAARNVPGGEREIESDLAWLGIEWDDGPVRQSTRQDAYRAAAERLGTERFGKITLLRPDGTATYHLASVVDDIDFEITHVIRGSDHRPNEDLHRRLAEALGVDAAHVRAPPRARLGLRRAEALEAWTSVLRYPPVLFAPRGSLRSGGACVPLTSSACSTYTTSISTLRRIHRLAVEGDRGDGRTPSCARSNRSAPVELRAGRSRGARDLARPKSIRDADPRARAG